MDLISNSRTRCFYKLTDLFFDEMMKQINLIPISQGCWYDKPAWRNSKLLEVSLRDMKYLAPSQLQSNSTSFHWIWKLKLPSSMAA